MILMFYPDGLRAGFNQTYYLYTEDHNLYKDFIRQCDIRRVAEYREDNGRVFYHILTPKPHTEEQYVALYKYLKMYRCEFWFLDDMVVLARGNHRYTQHIAVKDYVPRLKRRQYKYQISFRSIQWIDSDANRV